MSAGRDLNAHAVIDGICHLAGEKTAPDQAIEPILLPGEIALDLLRCQLNVGRSDRFVRVLCALFRLKAARGGRIVVLTVAAENECPGSSQCFFAQAKRVGTHIGNETDRALAADVNALIKLLGDRHGAARRHVKLARSLLLQRGGRERRRGRTLLVRAFDALDGKDLVADLRHNIFHLLRRGRLFLFSVCAVVMGKELSLGGRIEQLCIQCPVFLRCECLDFLFTLVDHARGNRLHAPGAQAAPDFLPQKRAELIADNAVENAACLLRVNKVLVDGTRLLNALRDDLLCDLIKGHASGLFVSKTQKCLQMPGDCLALAVRVRCKIDNITFFRFLFQLLDQLALVTDRLIDRLEIVLDVHADLAFGQVTQVSHAGLDHIFLAQISLNGFRLCRRFHDHQVFVSHAHSSNSVTFRAKCFPLPWRTYPSISRTVSAERTRRVGSCVFSITSST